MSITAKLKARVKQSEGWRAKVYTCPAGKLTIGYGFNVEDTELPKEVAELWLTMILAETEQSLLNSKNGYIFKELSPERKGVLIDMAYNLGLTGVLRFKKMWAALCASDYTEAARQMLDSKWADQVGQRAYHLAETMRTNKE